MQPMIPPMISAAQSSADASGPVPARVLPRFGWRSLWCVRWDGFKRWWREVRWWHLLVSGVLLLFVSGAIYEGLRVREAAWFYSQGIHFRGDIGNGWRWGEVANKYGLFDLYDILENEGIEERRDKIDYTPLRLTVMTRWVAWTQKNFPGATRWQDEYTFTRPLLDFNTATELASTVLLFFIIRLWRVRMHDAGRALETPRPAFCGIGPAMFGAMLFWFNPSIIWNSHAWPQWDVWLIPFFLAALLSASLNCWFVAGGCIVIGAFLKGQILLGAPVLILWPLFSGRFMAVVHFFCGFVFMAAVLAAPWMHIDKPASTWLALLMTALAIQIPIVMKVRVAWYWIAAIVLASILLAWPWRSTAPPGVMGVLGPWIVLSMLLVRYARRWDRPQFYGLAIGLAVLLTMLYYQSSTAWYTMGFEFGAEKFENMMTGSGSWNIPAMLVRYFRFDSDPMEMVQLPFLTELVPVRKVLSAIYLVLMLLCGVAAAVQAKRRDTRFLATMVAPWLIFFLVLVQMHGRYSLWAAGISALMAGVGVGPALLGIVISVVSVLGILEGQLRVGRVGNAETQQILRNLDPHMGFLYVVIALVYLYIALVPRRNPHALPA